MRKILICFVFICFSVLLLTNENFSYCCQVNAEETAQSSEVLISSLSDDIMIDEENKIVQTAYRFIDEILERLAVAPGASVHFFDGTHEIPQGDIQSGCFLEVTAEDGITKSSYTIQLAGEAVPISVTSKSYLINSRDMTISSVPYTDKMPDVFLSNLIFSDGCVVEVLHQDRDETVFGALYTGCRLRVYSAKEELFYKIVISEYVHDPSVNIALNKSVTATGNAGKYVAAQINDGNIKSQWTPSKNGDSVTIDMGGVVNFDKIVLKELETLVNRAKVYRVDASVDQLQWEPVFHVDGDMNIGIEREFVFEVKTARYIRLTCVSAAVSSQQPHIVEMEVYCTENYACGISSYVYSIDDQNKTIADIDTTDVTEFLTGLIPVSGGSIVILDSSGIPVSTGVLQEDMTVRTYAQVSSIYSDYKILLNKRPQITSIAITGQLDVGSVLTASVQSDVPLDEVEYEWLYADTFNGVYVPIPGATGNSYNIKQSDKGKYLTVSVVPYAATEPSRGQRIVSDQKVLVGDWAYLATATSDIGSADYITDGRYDTGWSTVGASLLTIEFGQQRPVSSVSVFFANAQNTGYSLQYMKGSQWETILTRWEISQNEQLYFDEVQTKAIRLIFAEKGEDNYIYNLNAEQHRLKNSEIDSAIAQTQEKYTEYFAKLGSLKEDIILSRVGEYGASIHWSSNSPNIVIEGEKGRVVPSETTQAVSLKALIESGGVEKEIIYSVSVEGKKNSDDSGNRRPSGSASGGGSGSGGAHASSGSNVYVDMDILNNGTAIDTKPENTLPIQTFQDIESHWAKEDIQKLLEYGILSQDEENNFYPDRNLTRGEFCKMIVLAFDKSIDDASCSFNDVDQAIWSYPYIAALATQDIVRGIGDSLFGPFNNITREDAAVMVYRAIGQQLSLQNTDSVYFDDENSISDYAKQAVEALAAGGYIQGRDNQVFEPKSYITRAEICTILIRLLEDFKV